MYFVRCCRVHQKLFLLHLPSELVDQDMGRFNVQFVNEAYLSSMLKRKNVPKMSCSLMLKFTKLLTTNNNTKHIIPIHNKHTLVLLATGTYNALHLQNIKLAKT